MCILFAGIQSKEQLDISKKQSRASRWDDDLPPRPSRVCRAVLGYIRTPLPSLLSSLSDLFRSDVVSVNIRTVCSKQHHRGLTPHTRLTVCSSLADYVLLESILWGVLFACCTLILLTDRPPRDSNISGNRTDSMSVYRMTRCSRWVSLTIRFVNSLCLVVHVAITCAAIAWLTDRTGALCASPSDDPADDEPMMLWRMAIADSALVMVRSWHTAGL